jgi:hypothetical protein
MHAYAHLWNQVVNFIEAFFRQEIAIRGETDNVMKRRGRKPKYSGQTFSSSTCGKKENYSTLTINISLNQITERDSKKPRSRDILDANEVVFPMTSRNGCEVVKIDRCDKDANEKSFKTTSRGEISIPSV